MSEHLCVCGQPVADAAMCAGCGHALDDHIAQVAEQHGLGWDLDIAISRQARMDLPGGKPDLEPYDDQPGTLRPTPIPYDDRASRAARRLKAVLGTWVLFVDRHLAPRPAGPACRSCVHGSCVLIRRRDLPADTVTAKAVWLRPRVGWLRHHPAGSVALDEIRDAVRAARRVIDRPADLLYAGPCQRCDVDLYARTEADFVTCPNPECRTTYDVGELRAWLLKSAEDVLATATEISRALTRYAQPITPSAIRGYAHRGQLLPRGEQVEGARTSPLYRLGDVMECARLAAERNARIGA